MKRKRIPPPAAGVDCWTVSYGRREANQLADKWIEMGGTWSDAETRSFMRSFAAQMKARMRAERAAALKALTALTKKARS